ncbi:glycosyl transferase [Rhizobium sp. Rhizsp82]|uniref:glycosyl transferase n=1 Tax=Rhizobium sp. Rhizsp82 TaxID=3243057 RepID=UPI0039B55178
MNRPLLRSLLRLAARCFLGRARGHYEEWFPWLRLEKPGPAVPGGIFYKSQKCGELQPLSVLRERAGDALHIVGSGPSVKLNDLRLIPDFTAILLNGAMSLSSKEIKAPLAIAVEDERFVWRHFPMLKVVDRSIICLLSVAAIRAICQADAGWFHDRIVILIDNVRKPYEGARRDDGALAALDFVRLSPAHDAGFSLSPERGVFQGGSVAVTAFQFAVACDVGTIGFFGVDISNANSPRFYETTADAAYSGIAAAEKRILAHVALGVAVADERCIKVCNFSPISSLNQCGLPYNDSFALRGAAGEAG